MGRRFPFVLIFILTALCICCAYYLHVPWDLRADTEAETYDLQGRLLSKSIVNSGKKGVYITSGTKIIR